MSDMPYGYLCVGGVEYPVELEIDERNGDVTGYLLLSPREKEGTPYLVRPQNDAGTCTCPHYTIRLRGTKRTCKHIDRVREAITDGELGPVVGYSPRVETMEVLS